MWAQAISPRRPGVALRDLAELAFGVFDRELHGDADLNQLRREAPAPRVDDLLGEARDVEVREVARDLRGRELKALRQLAWREAEHFMAGHREQHAKNALLDLVEVAVLGHWPRSSSGG